MKGKRMDLEQLLVPVERKQVKPCKVGVLLQTLEGKYLEAVTTMLDKSWAQGGVTDDYISGRLVSAGVPIGASTIRRHRKRECLCEQVG